MQCHFGYDLILMLMSMNEAMKRRPTPVKAVDRGLFLGVLRPAAFLSVSSRIQNSLNLSAIEFLKVLSLDGMARGESFVVFYGSEIRLAGRNGHDMISTGHHTFDSLRYDGLVLALATDSESPKSFSERTRRG